MKQKDITVILVAGIVSAVFSLVLSQALFGAKSKNMTAEVVDPISSEFKEPDKKVFNDNSVNPTQLIRIGDSNNSSPF